MPIMPVKDQFYQDTNAAFEAIEEIMNLYNSDLIPDEVTLKAVNRIIHKYHYNSYERGENL
jgi:hypothetical protein